MCVVHCNYSHFTYYVPAVIQYMLRNQFGGNAVFIVYSHLKIYYEENLTFPTKETALVE